MAEKKCPPCRLNSVGGQAVIEGVMMKNGTRVALAVRKEDGSVEINNSEFHPLKEKHKWLNIPVLRGIVGFIESMVLSVKTLNTSTNMLGLDELEEKERAEKQAKKERKRLEKQANKQGVSYEELAKTTEDVAVKEEKTEKKSKNSSSTGIIMVLSLIFGFALAMFLFMALPTMATDGINYLVTKYTDFNGINHYLQAGIEGVIKILIFIVYIASVSFMKDIRRTFAYHGAEHKSIACYEKGLELTPENAKKCSRFHPRCGTSFLFVMLIISIIVGMFIPEFDSMPWLRVVCKIATLPLIMGIGYEFIMLAGKHNNWFTRMLSAPGLWMQRLTTKEPNEHQLAIAICAIKATMPEEFPDFDLEGYRISHEENREHIMYEA